MSALGLRCYCCGTPITSDTFALVSMQTEADRVFVFLADHTERADDAAIVLLVVKGKGKR